MQAVQICTFLATDIVERMIDGRPTWLAAAAAPIPSRVGET